MDGRDIGSYVLPNADVKIFLNADIKERARRRYSEQLSKNIENITLEEVLKDIEYRDKNDSSRSFAPLTKASDAIEIDTTNMSIDEVVNTILGYVKSYG
jgi:cytidylate kinase